MNNDKITELRKLAARIDQWRITRDLSKNQLVQKFGQLGSTKTFARLLDAEDDLSSLSVDNQLTNYNAAWEVIQAYKLRPEDLIYKDFDWVKEAVATINEAKDEPGNSHFVLVTGASGAGKTTIRNILTDDPITASITYDVEATEAWREKPGALLGALLQAIGIFERTSAKDEKKTRTHSGMPVGSNARLEKLVERINGRKVILAIDEFHHVGPSGYNIVKTIINQTSAVVVGFAIPALIARINRHSYEEAAQLFYNRLYQHVRLGVPGESDTRDFLDRRGVEFATKADAAAIARKVAQDSLSYGMWKYVERCARRGREAEAPHTEASFAKVIESVKRNVSLSA